jgi:hypothetical protein
MIDNCYSFKELVKKYGWEEKGLTLSSNIQDQIEIAHCQGVEIKLAFKKGPTYFHIVQDNHEKCYSFNELKEKYNWEYTNGNVNEQIKFASRRGVQIRPLGRKGCRKN